MRLTGKKIFIIVLLLLAVFVSGFLLWANDTLEAEEAALRSLKGNKDVNVKTERFITFEPEEMTKTGFIFYPGAKVEPEAYAPLALEIAESGIFTVITPMPLNLAIFGVDKALGVMNNYPEISNWFFGGHSLGGAMAAQFTHSNPRMIRGLILLAAYPAKNSRLNTSDTPVLSIYASEDGLATVEKIDNTKQYLPGDTEFVLIEGGNHAQFGDYGEQKGDKQATISEEEQRRITVEKIVEFIEKNK